MLVCLHLSAYIKQHDSFCFQPLFFIVKFVMVQVASVMTVWNHIQPDYAANIWNEALNKRLGTQVFYQFIPHLVH